MAIKVASIRRGSRRKREINCEINVTPFVDVMLVLLVIFMVASPMLVAGVQVDLPKTKAAALSGQDEPVAISINKAGEVFIQETKIKTSELPQKLSAIVKEKKDTRIFVRGDKSVEYGAIMEVFGSIKSAGFKNVALVTEAIND